ncbi:MAG TPA: Gfo/Idh/MocA family oxidoreductase [Candidatus Dormibacteraeota bacterium]|jgi:1,5-anhydro-D-fructose reductase (1,5-anhydro-D-mannitol-forming)|nr:Gfo/Idh/MocA family oxidoreductase [Candidatus Dormibacteraeota bacterium]
MLNWIVVGIGDIATRRVIPAIQAEHRSLLYALVTRDPAKAARYNTRVWDRLDEALADPAVQAVYVATPVFLHAPQTIQSLRAGKHVLCEKPMAMNEAEARSMVQSAAETGRTLGVAYYRRSYPKVQRAKQLLAAGAIGQPVLAELTSHGWFDGKDRSWLIDPAQAGGGPLYDIGSHRIDVLNFLFGEPQRVTGHLSNAVHHYAVEDNATVMIEYAGGVRGIVDVCWHSKVKRDECRFRGTEGEMDLSPLNGPELVYPGGRESIPPHANLHYPMIENFVDAVLGKAPLLASGASSFWTDWVIERAGR